MVSAAQRRQWLIKNMRRAVAACEKRGVDDFLSAWDGAALLDEDTATEVLKDVASSIVARESEAVGLATSGDTYEITLPEGLGGSQWQGQFHIDTQLTASASKQYHFQLVMETDQDCPNVTIKLTDSGDSNFFCEGRHNIKADEPYVFTLKNATLKEGTDASAIRLFFDFGGSPAGTNVKISKIIFKEAQ